MMEKRLVVVVAKLEQILRVLDQVYPRETTLSRDLGNKSENRNRLFTNTCGGRRYSGDAQNNSLCRGSAGKMGEKEYGWLDG